MPRLFFILCPGGGHIVPMNPDWKMLLLWNLAQLYFNRLWIKWRKKNFKNASYFLLTSSNNFAETSTELLKLEKQVPFSQISIPFDLDGIFTFCYQFLKDKRGLLNIYATFQKILIPSCQKLVQILSVLDLSAFFLIDPLTWDWHLVTWQNLPQKCISVP